MPLRKLPADRHFKIRHLNTPQSRKSIGLKIINFFVPFTPKSLEILFLSLQIKEQLRFSNDVVDFELVLFIIYKNGKWDIANKTCGYVKIDPIKVFTMIGPIIVLL